MDDKVDIDYLSEQLETAVHQAIVECLKKELPPKQQPALELKDRFIPAWGELGQRVNARQNVQLTYVTAIGVVFAALVAASYSDKEQGKYATAWLAIFMPVLGLVFTAWFCHHDLNIGILNRYLQAIEECDEVNTQVPRWFVQEDGFGCVSHSYRPIILWAFGFLQCLALIPIFLLLLGQIGIELNKAMTTMAAFSCVVVVLPIVGLIYSNILRKQLKGKEVKLDEHGRMRLEK